MDINQATQTISWLDEELRRAKSLLVELRQKVESQAVEINDQAKRVQELEGRLAGTQAKLTRFNILEQAIQQSKEEVLQLVRQQEADLQRYQRDQAKARQLELENSSRALNELKRSLETIPPLQERLTILKAEDQRLGEAVLNLQTRLTSHERQMSQLPDRIAYVEGQRAQDLKGVTQVQEEVVELMRRTESQAGKLELVDDIARKSEQRINALASYREEITARQRELIEDSRLKEAQRDRQLQDWQADMARHGEEMAKQRKLLERFGRKQEEAQQYLASIEDYKNTINREQKQVSELQRLSEERQRRELEEWVSANEQRWTKFRLEREAQWNQQLSRNEDYLIRLKTLEGLREEDLARVHKVSRELLLIQEEYRTKLSELWVIHEKTAIFHLDQSRRWYDEISGATAEKIGNK